MVHKAGFVNIVGNPNVGKSTLMNLLVGERLSIITSKSQTTRHRILGIVNGDDFQILFSDTPGIIKPAYNLQESMMNFVKSAFDDADILLYMVEIGKLKLKDENLFNRIKLTKVPVLLLINKIDMCSTQKEAQDEFTYWQKKVPNAKVYLISALENFGVKELLNKIIDILPESKAFYPKDQLTDKPERFFVNEYIREKIFLYYKKEIPYSVEIETEKFYEEEKIIKIRSIIMVERESQKGIIIGHKGNSLKRIGVEGRKDLERLFNKKIFLELYVKVNKNWRNNTKQLRRFGYK